MDAPTLPPPSAAPPAQRSPAPISIERRNDLILEALRVALTDPRAHRLFQSGRHNGLFPSRFGSSADAALFAIKEGLFETVTTEVKGKLIIEWVRATAKGVGFVHDHDSPKAILRDLKVALGDTRNSLPLWMADVRGDIATLTAKLEEQSRQLADKIDELTRRLDAALRRGDASVGQPDGALSLLVPWSTSALEYLDRRRSTGLPAVCPLSELFHAIRETFPALTVPHFHDGLRRLHDSRAVRLSGVAPTSSAHFEAEFALLVGAESCQGVSR